MKKLLLVCILIASLFLSPTIIAYADLEVKIMPQLKFIEFIEENEVTKATVKYGEEMITLSLGDEIREMEVYDFVENKIIFERSGRTVSLKRGHSLPRVFVQSWIPVDVEKEEENEDNETEESQPDELNGLEGEFDYTGVDLGNVGPITIESSFVLEYKATEPDIFGTAAFQIYYDSLEEDIFGGLAANTMAPAEGSYYINQPGEYVFDINTSSGVEWGIKIIEQ